MAKSTLQVNQFPLMLRDVGENFGHELAGIALLGIGGVAAFRMVASEDVTWLARMTGWVAPLVIALLLIAGVVALLRGRAGYWSAEALLGAELGLIALMAGTFVVQHSTHDGTLVANGEGGGLIGWTLGGILVGGLGQWPAFFVVSVMGVTAFLLLLRYTPLIYLPAYAVRLGPPARAYWEWWLLRGAILRGEEPLPPSQRLPYSANFVAPYGADEFVGGNGNAAPTAVRSPGRGSAPAPANGTTTVRGRKSRTTALSPVRRRDLPSLDLLTQDGGVYAGGDVRAMEYAIERTLADFGVPVRVVHVESGPTVTQFGVEPLFVERSGQKRKVRVNRILSLADDLALALAAPAIRIEAPVPGRPYVGIEAPNAQKSLVSLRGILESTAMASTDGKLLLALGRDTAGAPVILDLVRAPHLLIAGATGAGKSVCINTIIAGLLMQHGPESLKFVMVDPKMVELPGYNGIPHLLGKVITDMEQVMGALTWLLLQMDDRYQLFRQAGVRNVEAYNEHVGKLRQNGQGPAALPYIVLIIDELADLMMTAADDIERQICRLAQMARATGIHLILATQRPSTDVVTGLIKANFPTRIAFAVSSQIDSRVILDTPGAERLLGRGDMLLMRPDSPKLFRLQGCFVTDDEIVRVVGFWRSRTDAGQQPVVPPWNALIDVMDEEDELIQDAVDLLRGMRSCSTSMLQRKLKLGYPKAARLMEELEGRGIVGPDLGGGQGREVLLEEDEEEAERDVL